MKLTNYMRDAYVKAVLADTPNEFKVLEERAHKLVLDAFVAKLPAAVQRLWKTREMQHYIRVISYSFTQSTHGAFFTSVAVPSGRGDDGLALEVVAQVRDLGLRATEVTVEREEMRGKFKAAAYACGTRKQLAEIMPEFEKYLPTEPVAAAKSELAVTNVVADFVKAGWPKGGK